MHQIGRRWRTDNVQEGKSSLKMGQGSHGKVGSARQRVQLTRVSSKESCARGSWEHSKLSCVLKVVLLPVCPSPVFPRLLTRGLTNPSTTTSILRLSNRSGAARSMSWTLTLEDTRPPVSRQTLAAADSRANPLRLNTPATAHAARWWPLESSGRPHRQERLDEGNCNHKTTSREFQHEMLRRCESMKDNSPEDSRLHCAAKRSLGEKPEVCKHRRCICDQVCTCGYEGCNIRNPYADDVQIGLEVYSQHIAVSTGGMELLDGSKRLPRNVRNEEMGNCIRVCDGLVIVFQAETLGGLDGSHVSDCCCRREVVEEDWRRVVPSTQTEGSHTEARGG